MEHYAAVMTSLQGYVNAAWAEFVSRTQGHTSTVLGLMCLSALLPAMVHRRYRELVTLSKPDASPFAAGVVSRRWLLENIVMILSLGGLGIEGVAQGYHCVFNHGHIDAPFAITAAVLVLTVSAAL